MTTIRPFTCEDLFRYNNVVIGRNNPTSDEYASPEVLREEARYEILKAREKMKSNCEKRHCVAHQDGRMNLDPLTETYGLSFYLQYLAHWPEYFQVAEAPNGDIMGYIMGKAEGHSENWHGHVTALTVAPEYRRLGLAATLMAGLESISEKKKAYFVDLFVRISNKVAVEMYKQLGYSVYRRVLEYYSGDPDEDAFDMRKALSRDVNKKSVIPLTHPVRPEDIE